MFVFMSFSTAKFPSFILKLPFSSRTNLGFPFLSVTFQAFAPVKTRSEIKLVLRMPFERERERERF